MFELNDFFGSSDEAVKECCFCGSTDGELIVGVEDASGPTHWYHEACQIEDDAKKGIPLRPTWDEAMDEAE
jgi:hypothetical protein